MSSPIAIFEGESTQVPEGTSHRYSCRLFEDDGGALLVAAISDIRAWLDVAKSNTPINSRSNQNVRNANGGTLVDVGGGIAEFRLALDGADAAIVATPPGSVEQHRLTLKVTYAKSGGGTGTLTREIYYGVRAFARI